MLPSTNTQQPFDVQEIKCPQYFIFCRLDNIQSTKKTTFTYRILTPISQFICTNCTFDTIPFGLFANAPNLRQLHLDATDIQTIAISDFQHANSLQYLNLSRNNIEILEDSLFMHASLLKVIDLSYNRITTISNETFIDNNELEAIKLSNNRLATFTMTINNNLQLLYLDNNRLVFVDLIANSSISYLKLKLNNNSLTTTSNTLWQIHFQLFEISDNRNFQTSMDQINATMLFVKNVSNTMNNCHINANTEILDASHNHITNIIIVSSNKTFKIEELNLSFNHLSDISNLTTIKSIKILNLSNNNITNIGISTFTAMVNLIDLNLENSGLKTLDYGIFSQQHLMATLDISYNNLGHLDLQALSFLDNLKRLFVDGNNFTELKLHDIRSQFKKINIIGISNNNFNCSYLTSLINILNENNIELYIDPMDDIKHTRNVKGIGCDNETTTTHLNYWKIAPVHYTNHSVAYNEIESKLNSIIENVNRIALQDGGIGDNDTQKELMIQQNYQAIKNEISNIENSFKTQLDKHKSTIISNITKLFDTTTNNNNNNNGTNIIMKPNVDLLKTYNELTQLNTEHFEMFSQQLSEFLDHLNSIDSDVAAMKSLNEIIATNNNNNVSINSMILNKMIENQLSIRGSSETSGSDSNVVSSIGSIKIMIILMFVLLLLFICAIGCFINYQKISFRHQSGGRQFASNNTINTCVDQTI